MHVYAAKGLFAGFAGLALLYAASAAGIPHVKNPVWPEDFPDPTFWRAPDGTFRAAATSQKILKSKDFFTWTDAGKRIFSDAEYAQVKKKWKWIWAPDAFKLGDEYLMYVALLNSAEDSAIAVYSSKNADGPFTDGRIIVRGKDTGIKDTIDPEVVRDPETGTLWLFFGSTGKMHRVRLSPDGKSLAPGAVCEHVAGVDVADATTAHTAAAAANTPFICMVCSFLLRAYSTIISHMADAAGAIRAFKGSQSNHGVFTANSRRGGRARRPARTQAPAQAGSPSGCGWCGRAPAARARSR